MGERARATRVIGLGLSGAGLAGIVVSMSVLYDMWHARQVWLQSEQHQSVERQLAAAWSGVAEPDGEEPRPTVRDGQGRAGEATARAASHDEVANRGRADGGPRPSSSAGPPRRMPAIWTSFSAHPGEPQAPVGRDARALEVVRGELRFLNRLQPDAHAVLGLTIGNRSDVPSRPIVVGIPIEWFDHGVIIGAIPAVLEDRVGADGHRYFEFPGPSPGAEATLELHVTVTDQEVRAPLLRLAVRDGESLGELRPEVVTPSAPPGPVQALSVPRIGIRTGVVDTSWEPPPFVAGQISATASLGEGNSVLVGHRAGHAGDVFARLAGARLGDGVVAASGGAEHRYIVSEIRILPGSDSTPIAPTETPRLTLMTCIGAWNPINGDYSHRLWVIAEPRDLALSTLTATVARATHPATASSPPTEAARVRTDAALARAALALLQSERRGRH